MCGTVAFTLCLSGARGPCSRTGLSQRAFTAQRAFTYTARASASHFDTHLFVNRLQDQGLTRTQAEGVMNVLAEVIDESIRGMEGGLVSKAEQEKVSA